MAIDFTPNVITSGYNLSKINDNFTKIELALQEALSRTGTLPNQMGADIDLNTNDLLNVGVIYATDFSISGSDVTGAVTTAVNAAIAAAASAAQAAASAAFARNNWVKQVFTGDGVTTNFGLAADPGSLNNVFVNFSGSFQFTSSYTLLTSAGVTYVSFSEAPPSGLVFETRYGQAINVTTPSDGSVITAKLADGAVATVKVADKAVTYAKMQDMATARSHGRLTAGTGSVEELTAAQIRDSFLPSGSVIDSVSAFYATNADITAVLPLDDTIPQITEGTQILTVSITPKAAANKLRIRFQGEGSLAAGAAGMVAAIFDGAANALCASYETVDTANYGRRVTIEWEYSPGVVTAKTISVRVGPGAAGTLRMNGYSAARFLGGSSACSLIVEEIKA